MYPFYTAMIFRHQFQMVKILINIIGFQSVCKADFLKALKQLKSSKSSGTDTIPVNILKDTAEQTSGPLALQTNLSINLCQKSFEHQLINA